MTPYRLNDKVIHIGSSEECHITELRTLIAEGKTTQLVFAMSDDQNLFIGPESDFRYHESSPTQPAQPTVTLSDGTTAAVGARVLKITGEYHIEGIIVAVFHKADGTTPRLVVEHEAKPQGSFLHIYGPANLKSLPKSLESSILPVGTRVRTRWGDGTIVALREKNTPTAKYEIKVDDGSLAAIPAVFTHEFQVIQE